MFHSKRSAETPGKPDRVGTFFFRIFGPATVEGAIQGWSPEAQTQYKRMREAQKQAAAARRADPAR